MRQRAIHPAVRARALVVALALGALLGACGTAVDSVAPASPPPTLGPNGSAGGSPDVVVTVRAYYGLGSTGGNAVLAPVERPAPGATDLASRARAALEALIGGPLEAELSASPAMFTSVSADATIQGVQIDAAGVATVNFDEAFLGEDDLPALRIGLAQVVVTLTQFPEVSRVQVTIEGAVMEQTDAAGNQLAGPATRADYADVLGPIFVDDPVWGATLRSPFYLAGLADVFEAQFAFRLLDADGRSLADGQLTASCGTGCLGAYGVEVPFNVSASTTGRLQVFDLSEQDGSMRDLVDYPVTLLP